MPCISIVDIFRRKQGCFGTPPPPLSPKKCISSVAAAVSTCSGIWVGEEHLLVNKVKTQSLRAASSPLPLALARTS